MSSDGWRCWFCANTNLSLNGCHDLSCSRSQISDIIQFRMDRTRYAGWGESFAHNKVVPLIQEIDRNIEGKGMGNIKSIRTAYIVRTAMRMVDIAQCNGEERKTNQWCTQQKYYCIHVKLRIYNLHTPSCQTPLSHNSMVSYVSYHWRTSSLPVLSLFTRLQMGGIPIVYHSVSLCWGKHRHPFKFSTIS